MTARVKVAVPLWLHLVATIVAGLIWLWIAYQNATKHLGLDAGFAEECTKALGYLLLPRFAAPGAEEPLADARGSGGQE